MPDNVNNPGIPPAGTPPATGAPLDIAAITKAAADAAVAAVMGQVPGMVKRMASEAAQAALQEQAAVADVARKAEEAKKAQAGETPEQKRLRELEATIKGTNELLMQAEASRKTEKETNQRLQTEAQIAQVLREKALSVLPSVTPLAIEQLTKLVKVNDQGKRTMTITKQIGSQSVESEVPLAEGIESYFSSRKDMLQAVIPGGAGSGGGAGGGGGVPLNGNAPKTMQELLDRGPDEATQFKEEHPAEFAQLKAAMPRL